MFQIQELTPYFDAEWSPEHFDTFLNQIGQKTRRCGPKNCIRGVRSEKINFFFKLKANGMRDEMTLYKSESVNVDKAPYYLSKVLDDRKLQWVKQQKIVTKEGLLQLCNAALNPICTRGGGQICPPSQLF